MKLYLSFVEPWRAQRCWRWDDMPRLIDYRVCMRLKRGKMVVQDELDLSCFDLLHLLFIAQRSLESLDELLK